MGEPRTGTTDDFEGLTVFELKARPAAARDAAQLNRYMRHLAQILSGGMQLEGVLLAPTVGDTAREALGPDCSAFAIDDYLPGGA